MATTTESFTSGAGQVLFPFTIQYIAESDLKVAIDGTDTTAFTFANATTIELDTAPTTGAEVVIRRETDVDDINSEFFPGSSIRAQDLNNNFEQLLFSAQEDSGKVPLYNAVFPDDVSMDGNQIKDLGDPTDDQDAVNKQYLEDTTWDNTTETINSTEAWPSDDDTIATTGGIEARINAKIDTALTGDVAGSDGVTITDNGDGTITVGLGAGDVDFDRIKDSDIITYAEQEAGSPAPADNNIFTASAAARRFDTIVQSATPPGTDWETGKTWLQNNQDLTLSIWTGSAWSGIASGGTFTNQPKVVYVDSSSGTDSNDGHRISRPKASIKAAIDQINDDSDFGDGSVVVVAPGTYQETCPIDIEKSNVSIVGTALRSCIVHPTVATEEEVMFRVNSGTFLQNLTFTGMKASGALGNTADATLPVNQGWNIAFLPDCTIVKSPYIQNCTNFSDSEIDNSDINVITPGGGLAGDTDSAPTGGGVLIDGSVPSATSPLRSIVCDSYTHVGLNGPGLLVTNNGYTQCTSSYAFFNKYHIKCLNGGQANLAASTSDFGDQALVADGKSTTAIFTSNVDGAAADGDISFNVNEPDSGAGWFGSTQRPASNMLVEVNSVLYPILSAVENEDSEGGDGWTVTISRPNPSDRSENQGLNGAISDDDAVSFFLRSQIASSGHTMEYVGSGTDYRALPENGGVPDETKQITESNGGKIWTAITDHNGKFKIGGNQTDDPIFEVDQERGFITIPTGSIAFDLLSDETPQLGGNLDVNGNTITSTSDADVVIDPNGTGSVDVSSSRITNVTDPTDAQDAASKNYVDTSSSNTNYVAVTGDDMTGALAMGSNKITGLADPTAAQDAASKNYVDSTTTANPLYVAVAGDDMTGELAMGTNKITGLGDPTANQDAVTKTYVDSGFVVQTGANASAQLPVGTQLQRDGTPAAGMIRFNDDVDQFEGYNGTAWSSVGGGATGGGGDQWAVEMDNTITSSYTISTGKNVISAGPLTINSGAVVTVPSGSSWVIV